MFDNQMFIEMITDHVENPRHYGRMDDATVHMTYGNPGCGDLITVFLKLDDQERILGVTFVDENPTPDNPNPSCSVSRGATSILTEMVLGKTLAEIAELDAKAFVDEIGGHAVAATRPKCITLGLSATKAAEKRFRFQQHQAAQSAPE
jgi:nitrogen fixation protein NifU and related proteins